MGDDIAVKLQEIDDSITNVKSVLASVTEEFDALDRALEQSAEQIEQALTAL